MSDKKTNFMKIKMNNKHNSSGFTEKSTESEDDFQKLTDKEKFFRLQAKLRSLEKEEKLLRKEEDSLKAELERLQNNHREMVPGFNTNTSNLFPMITELQIKINDYIKISCQDIFFDLLQPEFNIKGFVQFFSKILNHFNGIVEHYFEPLEEQIKSTVALDGKLFEPIDNVLRKTYQSNFKNISTYLEKNFVDYNGLVKEIQKELELKILDDSSKFILEFCKKTYAIVYMCYICEPKIYIDLSQIGKDVFYNATTHDALDGFIKHKQKCTIILPAFYRGFPFSKDNIIVKSQVLALDYIQD